MKIKIVKLKGEKYLKLLKRNKDTINYSSGFVVLKKGQDVGEHKTDNVEEVIVFLNGTAELYVNGKKYKEISSPAVVYIPPNIVHNVVNKSKKTLKYIYITTKI